MYVYNNSCLTSAALQQTKRQKQSHHTDSRHDKEVGTEAALVEPEAAQNVVAGERRRVCRVTAYLSGKLEYRPVLADRTDTADTQMVEAKAHGGRGAAKVRMKTNNIPAVKQTKIACLKPKRESCFLFLS